MFLESFFFIYSRCRKYFYAFTLKFEINRLMQWFLTGMLWAVVNFINILRERFSYKKLEPKIQCQKVSRKKLIFKGFCTKKMCAKRWWNWHQGCHQSLQFVDLYTYCEEARFRKIDCFITLSVSDNIVNRSILIVNRYTPIWRNCVNDAKAILASSWEVEININCNTE